VKLRPQKGRQDAAFLYYKDIRGRPDPFSELSCKSLVAAIYTETIRTKPFRATVAHLASADDIVGELSGSPFGITLSS
jgi:hypothetical protein